MVAIALYKWSSWPVDMVLDYYSRKHMREGMLFTGNPGTLILPGRERYLAYREPGKVCLHFTGNRDNV